MDSEDADSYLILALAYYDSGQLQQAVEASTKAIQIAPDFTEAYFIRGHILESLGDQSEAEEDYDSGYDEWPYSAPCGGPGVFLSSNPIHYFKKGRTLIRRGDKKGAIENLQRAAEIFQARGNMERYQESIKLISQLQG